jgi:hypothetical protein
MRRSSRSASGTVVVPRRRRRFRRAHVLAALALVLVAAGVGAVVARAVLLRALADQDRRSQLRRLVRAARRPLSPWAVAVWRDSVAPEVALSPGGARRPTLPRRLTYDTVRFFDPAHGRTLRADDADALRAALDDALPGDQILLRRGAEYRGTFLLPAKRGAGARWITLRTDLGGDSLPSGTRMTAELAAPLRLARLVVATNGEAPALGTDGAASRWRVTEIEVTAAPGLQELRDLIRLGDPNQRDLRRLPQHLVLDRVYVHGLVDTPVRRCVHLASGATLVANSTAAECHLNGFDSIALGGWAGPGPYGIVNNSLAGAAIGILFGGATPGVDSLLPADIEIRGNLVTRPESWQGRYTTKTLIELKAGRRVLIEGNVLEHNWADAQAGFAVLLKSVNQYGDAPWSELSDVTVRHNVLRRSAGGFNVAAAPEPHPAVPAHRIAIEGNLAYDVGSYRGTGQGRMVMLLGPLADVIVSRNTLLHNAPTGQALLLDGGNASRRLDVTGNTLTFGEYGVWASEGGDGAGALQRAWPGSWTFTGNTMLCARVPDRAASYPDGGAGLLGDPALLARAHAVKTLPAAATLLDALRRGGASGAPLDSIVALATDVARELAVPYGRPPRPEPRAVSQSAATVGTTASRR